MIGRAVGIKDGKMMNLTNLYYNLNLYILFIKVKYY